MKASYRRLPSEKWEGVVKDDKGKIVWACGHAHDCRDYNHCWVYVHKGAAMYCSKAQLKLMCEKV